MESSLTPRICSGWIAPTRLERHAFLDLAEDSLTQAQFERIAELEAGLLVTLSEMYLKEGFSLQEFCTQTRHMTLTLT